MGQRKNSESLHSTLILWWGLKIFSSNVISRFLEPAQKKLIWSLWTARGTSQNAGGFPLFSLHHIEEKKTVHQKLRRTNATDGHKTGPFSKPFTSQKWFTSNFSLWHPYIIQQTANENTQTYEVDF